MALRRAERAQQQSGERLDLVLARLGLVGEQVLAEAIAAELGLPLANRSELPEIAVAEGLVDPAFLKSKRMLPISLDADRLVVAVADPFDDDALGALAFHIDRRVEPCIATAGDIERRLEAIYGASDPAALATETAQGTPTAQEDDVRRLEDLASEAPIIRLAQSLIVRAVEARASDIHLEPRADSLRVRFRIDGVLHTIEKLPPDVAAGLVSRIKIMSRLDIAERRLPQDGRARSVVRGHELDLRVSTVPTMAGESCVLRILDRSALQLDLPTLGFDAALRERLAGLLKQPHGIVLVTGPTGSGKTTTLYTALASLDAESAKILTVEDPIEYRLPDINQIQVQPRIGLTFASTLRSILRQDPDVIMIGEIRDLETAQIAIQASLTGHLVLSTVHTNSASATITRLIDMGVESYLLASSVTGVLAQRLVRRLCGVCAAPHEPPAGLMKQLVAEAGGAWRGSDPRMRRRVGCPACRGTGYDGRIAIGELLVLDTEVRELVQSRASDQVIERAGCGQGMTTLHQSGLARVLAGETTLEEVLRVTRLG